MVAIAAVSGVVLTCFVLVIIMLRKKVLRIKRRLDHEINYVQDNFSETSKTANDIGESGI